MAIKNPDQFIDRGFLMELGLLAISTYYLNSMVGGVGQQ
jgi:hypothetical protein